MSELPDISHVAGVVVSFLKGEGFLGEGYENIEKLIVGMFAVLMSYLARRLYKNYNPFGKDSQHQVRQGRYIAGRYPSAIVPVSRSFDWENENPRKYRPYKPGPYFMTMGLRALDPNDWLLLENTYKDITKARAEIVENHRDNTVLTNPLAIEAVDETYDMFVNYITKKFPKYFYTTRRRPGYIYNAIKKDYIPSTSEQYDKDFEESIPDKKERMDSKIRLLAKHFEEDFLILIYDEKTQQYYLRAGSFAFPSGFNPAEKLNLALKDIHGPVPLYKEKIENAMDRFFHKIEVGKWVQRYNWSIQGHTNLYAPTLNHAKKGAKLKAINPDELDFDKVFLRVERQVLTRLPNTKHLLFTIRTYVTPLSQIREEDRALELVEAIDNLPDNVAHYKKRDEWGPAVKAYLQRESDGIKKK
ncbi:hypothetical protein AWJ20_214 [Sugiyamaella lignohabitans]|uniref:Uncharacterized protein n=1 Tax=Sugiyamaella lignohabitans TaxID=796027 RepID=A0A167CQJ3_9ASCO|nr:uncharacterized protein AWJ20_214 [Sugiyamaella lignohabitans]ANB11986.1 hypothetical protein AWJ20_214 [Sugiyamaella lignohabitans]